MLLKFYLFWIVAGLSAWTLMVDGAPSDADDGTLIPPITRFSRGYNRRVEYITATINRGNLDTGTPPTSRTREYSKSMSPYQHDDAGHLIAARLGGTGQKTYNIVPHNRTYNRGKWRTEVEDKVYQDVKAGNVVTYEVWPQYDSRTATRPYALRYRAVRSDGTVVVQGSMDNPTPDK